jgi:NADPH-dependent 2,4-dienoyl-CoA reductase/sulfur reductase-like enzyme
MSTVISVDFLPSISEAGDCTYARGQPKGPIAIVGGGVAGLTAAYRLHQAGKTPIVFEASNRWGGRMFTKYDAEL